MSYLTRSRFDHLSKRCKEHFFHSDNDEEEGFALQYVPPSYMQNIVKMVRRKRTQEEHDQAWHQVMEEQEFSKDSSLSVTERTTTSQYLEERNKAKSSSAINLSKKGNDYSQDFYDRISGYNDFRKSKANKYGQEMTPDFNSISNEFSENESYGIRPDPVSINKIIILQRKISSLLDGISYELDRITLPDGDKDYQRRLQRITEFSTRISRNYLYELNRQVVEIKRHIDVITSKYSNSQRIQMSRNSMAYHMQAVEQKLISTHQLLLHALSAYYKHIQSSVLRGHPGKLKDLLQIVVDMKHFCAEINLIPEFYYSSGDEKDILLGKETESRCSNILSKFQNKPSDNGSQSAHTHTTLSTAPTLRKKKNKKALSHKLNMYCTDMRSLRNYYPRKSQSLHYMRSEDNKKSNKSIISSRKIIKPQNSIITKSISKMKSPLKEDDIKTVIESIPTELVDSCSLNGKNNELENTNKTLIIENEIDKPRMENDVSIVDEKYLLSLVPVISDLMSLAESKQQSKTSSITVQDFLHKIHQTKHSSSLKSQQPKSSSNDIKQNMQLICYTADDENIKEQLKCPENKNEMPNFTEVSCQANYLKTSTLQITESAKLCILDYKKKLANLFKNNALYTSNSKNKPWEVVSWISEKLVEELILEIADELQIQDTIQKLYDLEFKEF